MRRLRVHFAGAVGSTGCENNGTCPRCELRWERQSDGLLQWSKTFVGNAGGYVELPLEANGSADPLSIPLVSGMGIMCSVPSGNRIRGYTGWASQTRVSQGQ
jgi:hypothetical protein